MAFRFRVLRGTAAQVAAFTGEVGQLVLDTENHLLYVQDGVTAGGHPVAGLTEAAVQALIDASIEGLSIDDITGLQAALDAKAATADLLDGGLIKSELLPSYVDDVLEFANQAAFPGTGETGKIYVALDTNLIYRWSGSAYVQVASGALASTDNLTEGVTNLYFTQARARNAISVTGDSGLSYDSATGVLTYTAPEGGSGPAKASDAEAVDGTDDEKYVTAHGVAAVVADLGFSKDGEDWVLDEGVLS